jgi:hypothetical protein
MSIQGKASAVKHGIADNTTTIKELFWYRHTYLHTHEDEDNTL